MALTDITGRSSKMSPNAAILCPRTQSDPDSPQFIGHPDHTRRDVLGVSLERTVNGKTVLELKFTPKESH
jgi:hypothetical protein